MTRQRLILTIVGTIIITVGSYTFGKTAGAKQGGSFREGYYKGKLEVLESMRDIYMPAPSSDNLETFKEMQNVSN